MNAFSSLIPFYIKVCERNIKWHIHRETKTCLSSLLKQVNSKLLVPKVWSGNRTTGISWELIRNEDSWPHRRIAKLESAF